MCVSPTSFVAISIKNYSIDSTVAVVAVFLFILYRGRTADLQPTEGQELWHAEVLDPKEPAVTFLQLLAMTSP